MATSRSRSLHRFARIPRNALAPVVIALVLALALALALERPQLASAETARPVHSAADIAQARELFARAMAQRDAGDAKGAVDKFAAAHALAGTPITGLELGRTQMTLGTLVEARESFLSVSRIPVSAQETAHATAAREEAAQLAEKLRARIPSLTVHVTGVEAAAASVVIDGVGVPTAALSVPRLVNPGTHTLRASSPSGRASADVFLKEGESHPVDLLLLTDKVAVTPPVVAPTPQPFLTNADSAGRTTDSRRPLLYAGIGVAGAGVVVGTVTGILALTKASTVNDACPGKVCGTNESHTISSGQTLGTVSTVGFIVAGAGAAAALVALFYPHSKEQRPPPSAAFSPWVGWAGAGVSGSF